MNLRKFAETAALAVDVNGGRISPQTLFTKEEDHYRIKVKAPGLRESNLKVELINQSIYVFQLVTDMRTSKNRHVRLPIEMFPLPTEVDFHNISAQFDGGVLNIVLPFNDLADGFRKGIKINA